MKSFRTLLAMGALYAIALSSAATGAFASLPRAPAHGRSSTVARAFVIAPDSAIGSSSASAAPAPDVLVVGGTAAGVAAALAAGRLGDDVVLVSAAPDLGGTLTEAMMDQWDLNLAPDGASVERGIFAEMYARLGDVFTPRAAARTFAAMIAADPRISVRYDESPRCVATLGEADGRRIESVTFVNVKSGRTTTISAPLVVDSTDSADVAALAGARYDLGRQDTGLGDQMQAVTLMFTITDVDWNAVAKSYDAERFGPGGVVDRRAWGYSTLLRAYRPRARAVVVRDLNLGLSSDGAVSVNAIDVTGVDGLVPAQLTAARAVSEDESYRLVDYLRERLPGFARARVASFAPSLYVRETRHVAGLERLTTDDVWDARIPSDSIGLASYPIDLHPVDPTDEPAYAALRHVYGIPFGTLVPRGLTNLVLASPAISASHLASGSARVIPTTIEEGEAAGTACAVARHDGFDIYGLATRAGGIDLLQDDLAAAGVLLGSPRPAVLARASTVSAARHSAAARIPA